MTFDSDTYFPQFSPSEVSLSQSDGHAENTFREPSTKPTPRKETKHEFCEDTEIANWEDEGGADPDSAGSLFGSNSLDYVSYLTAHIEAAENFMNEGKYDAAYSELEAAANRFINYKDKINSSFNNSIARLSTLGCRATSPHPKALPLIRLRAQVTA